MKQDKLLLVLDVDHTLLHAWVSEPVYDWLPADDPNRTPEKRKQYQQLLLEKFPGSYQWNDFVVCPRPHLNKLEEFLLSNPRIQFGFYSTGAPVYLEGLLPRVVPKLYKRALFIWGKDKCPRVKEVKMPYKDLNLVSEAFGISLEQMVMVDDLPTVVPWYSRLHITRFNLTHGIEGAMRDFQLLQLIKRLQIILDHDKGIQSQRIQDLHDEVNWKNLRELWLTINKRDNVTESDYPIPQPKSFDHVPNTLDTVKDLLP